MRTALLIAGALLPLCGCGGPYKIVPVQGRVTIDGVPAKNVLVQFEPVGGEGNVNPGPGSAAITDGDGRYSLVTLPQERPGAVVGKHRVMLSLKSGGETDDDLAAQGKPIPKSRPAAKQLPRRYNEQTTLTFEVPPGGSTSADFEVASK